MTNVHVTSLCEVRIQRHGAGVVHHLKRKTWAFAASCCQVSLRSAEELLELQPPLEPQRSMLNSPALTNARLNRPGLEQLCRVSLLAMEPEYCELRGFIEVHFNSLNFVERQPAGISPSLFLGFGLCEHLPDNQTSLPNPALS